jgi:hypothetical protein
MDTMNLSKYLIPAATVLALGMIGEEAHSSSNAPGSELHAAQGGNAGCLSRHTGYADVRNNCAFAVEVEGFLPILAEGWYPTRLVLFANNSWCQSVTTNGVGNGAHIGPATWTTAGPQTWQVLNLGDRFVWAPSALAFRCVLEPGGVIGEYGTNAS